MYFTNRRKVVSLINGFKLKVLLYKHDLNKFSTELCMIWYVLSIICIKIFKLCKFTHIVTYGSEFCAESDADLGLQVENRWIWLKQIIVFLLAWSTSSYIIVSLRLCCWWKNIAAWNFGGYALHDSMSLMENVFWISCLDWPW